MITVFIYLFLPVKQLDKIPIWLGWTFLIIDVLIWSYGVFKLIQLFI